MFTVPSLPTESLYKFLALGGIVAILTSFLLMVTEFQKIEVDNIKLNTKSRIYKVKDDSNAKAFDNARTEYKIIDEKYKSMTDGLNKALKLQNTSATLRRNPPRLMEEEGKKYTIEEYLSIIKKKEIREIEELTKKAQRFGKDIDPLNIEKVLIDEQKELLDQNLKYLNYIVYMWGAVTLGGLLCSIYGFKNWLKSQKMSDEISQLQLEKSRKELQPMGNSLSLTVSGKKWN